MIIAERLDNIHKDESNYYFREESKEECQKETTESKADELLTSLQRYNQSKEDKQKDSEKLKPCIHLAIL